MMEENERILLSIRDLKTYFPIKTGVFKRTTGYVKAVDGITLDLYKGETLGVVGESGCGKTTLCKSLVCLDPLYGGEVHYFKEDGTDIDLLAKENRDLLRNKVQYIFQDPQSSLNPAFTIYKSMEDALAMHGYKTKKEREKVLGDLFEAVNMRREGMNLYPNEFSGGQRQRIGIARALSVGPEIVICDEAVSALDVSIQAQVLNLLKKLKEERNLTYMFITHDLGVVEYISDRIAVLYLGRIVEMGDTDDLFSKTFHPYTEALRSAIPSDEENRKERIILTGDVPSPANPPCGCPFHPRCWKCKEICKTKVPELRKYSVNGKEYFVACHVAHEELEKMEVL
jgi:oligopeptide/dipeptide ABC transporter ATP-binding protein